MATSKLIRTIILLLFIISCANPKIRRYDLIHKNIYLKNWDISKTPINKVRLLHYQKNSNFNILKQENKLDTINVYTKGNSVINIKFSNTILTENDHKLIINDTIIYKIKNIKTSYKVKPHIPLSIDSTFNMIKSMYINGKEYNFKKPRVFTIPNSSYIIEKE